MNRLRHIDALRGLAAMAVVFRHYFGVHFAEVLPYGGVYSDFIVFKYGANGVELFFLISGYVILMSLEKTKTYGTFIYKRWLRLFPAMLIASILIFSIRFADRSFINDPPALVDIIPGLLFISPPFLDVASLHLFTFASLDGVFWTLYTEASFYLIFGLLFFWFDRRIAIGALVVIAVACSLGPELLRQVHAPAIFLKLADPFVRWLNWDMFGWFAAGALFYWAEEAKSRGLFVGAIAVALAAALMTFVTVRPETNVVEEMGVFIVIIALFALATSSRLVQRLLDNPPLVFMGFISYPLYLLHCNLGLIEINAIDWLIPGLPAWALGGLTFLTFCALGYLIARYGEPAVKAMIMRGVALASGKGGGDRARASA